MSCFAIGAIWLLLRDFAAAGWGERLLLLFLAPGMTTLSYFTATWVTVRFERTQGVIEIERHRLFGRIEERYPLAELVKARRDARDDSEGVTYRLLLVFSSAYLEALDDEVRDRLVRARRRGFRQTQPNEVPLTHYFTGFGDLASIADRINTWCLAAANRPSAAS